MRTLLWIRVILFGTAAAVFLSVISLMIDGLIRPQREILFISLTLVVYIIVAIFAAAGGAVLSLAILIFRSFVVSMIAAVGVGTIVSFGLIEGAVEVYRNPTYFDAPMFYADIVQVILNLVIFPSVGYLTWKIFDKELRKGTR